MTLSEDRSSPAARIESDRREFGYEVLGPIFLEWAVRLFAYSAQSTDAEQSRILSCTRAGLRMQLVYEAYLSGRDCVAPIDVAIFPVSRITAVRGALSRRSPAALEEIGFECRTLGQAFRSLAPRHSIDPVLDIEPYDPQAFLKAATEDADFWSYIEEQRDLLGSLVSQLMGDRTKPILSDSGLYGSTVKVLRDAYPSYAWRSVLLARSNYKRLPTPHFNITHGLLMQADSYAAWQRRSCLLRYWHLVESALEPPLKSVSSYSIIDGQPAPNVDLSDWRRRAREDDFGLFTGALAYVADNAPTFATSPKLAYPNAWRQLHRAITRPSDRMARTLDVGARSIDFGTEKTVKVVRTDVPLRDALKGAPIWRPGELAHRRAARLPLIAIVEAVLLKRAVSEHQQTITAKVRALLSRATSSIRRGRG